MLIEIDTKNWPWQLWHDIINWCLDTFGILQWGKTWDFQGYESIYLTEKNVTLMLLKWT